jgi:hypothetical protein
LKVRPSSKYSQGDKRDFSLLSVGFGPVDCSKVGYFGR